MNRVEGRIDDLKYRLRERLGGRAPILILPYRGYGKADELYLKGRVLEEHGIQPARETDTLWDNLVNMYRRFDSHEIPFARVQVRFHDTVQEALCDDEGFFETWIHPSQPLDLQQAWHELDLELLHPLRKGYPIVRAKGYVQVPSASSRFGVISDMDDTVIQTNTGRFLQMARTVFLGNAHTRLPFKGVAAFYKALNQGFSGDEQNPLFYVSSSPWNLYDMLTDFLEFNGLPEHPVMFLRDWGITEEEFLPINNRDHKMRICERMLKFYPDLPFILIGDSSQEDPEIYSEIVSKYPHRVQAIYIRNVSRKLDRPEAIRDLAKKVVEAGSTLILADDTLPLAEHAIEQGWIAASAFPEIRAEKKAEEAEPGPIEKALGVESKPPEPEAPTVVIQGQEPEQAKKAVEAGAIESALEEEGKEHKPPAVVVKGKEK